MTFPPVDALIPHREPMRLVDELVSFDGEGGGQVRAVLRRDRPYYDDGEVFGGHWVVELMAQSVAAVAGYETKASGRGPRIGYLISIDSFQLLEGLERSPPGSELLMTVVREAEMFPVGVYGITAERDGRTVARATMKFYIESDPARVLRSKDHRPSHMGLRGQGRKGERQP